MGDDDITMSVDRITIRFRRVVLTEAGRAEAGGREIWATANLLIDGSSIYGSESGQTPWPNQRLTGMSDSTEAVNLDLAATWSAPSGSQPRSDLAVVMRFSIAKGGQRIGETIVEELTKPYCSRLRRSVSLKNGNKMYWLYWEVEAHWNPECEAESEAETVPTAPRRSRSTHSRITCPDPDYLPDCWRTFVFNHTEYDTDLRCYFNWAPDFIENVRSRGGRLWARYSADHEKAGQLSNLKSLKCRTRNVIEGVVLHETGGWGFDKYDRGHKGLYHFLVHTGGVVTQRMDAATDIIHSSLGRKTIGVEIVNLHKTVPAGWVRGRARMDAGQVGLPSYVHNREPRDVIPRWYDDPGGRAQRRAYLVPTLAQLEGAYSLVKALLSLFRLSPSWPVYEVNGVQGLLMGPHKHREAHPQNATILGHASISPTHFKEACGAFPTLYTWLRHHGWSEYDAYDRALDLAQNALLEVNETYHADERKSGRQTYIRLPPTDAATAPSADVAAAT